MAWIFTAISLDFTASNRNWGLAWIIHVLISALAGARVISLVINEFTIIQAGQVTLTELSREWGIADALTIVILLSSINNTIILTSKVTCFIAENRYFNLAKITLKFFSTVAKTFLLIVSLCNSPILAWDNFFTGQNDTVSSIWTIWLVTAVASRNLVSCYFPCAIN